MSDSADADKVEGQQPSPFKGAVLERRDRNSRRIREGDVVLWHMTDEPDDCVACLVFWSGHKSAFCLQELSSQDAEYEHSFMRDGQYEVLGSSYDNPGLLGMWQALGFRGKIPAGFLPDHPEWCFPLAVLNACIGAGIPKASDPRLLEQLAMVGECPKWGVCIEEEAVLATASEWFRVRFVPASLEDIAEVGGVVTIRLGKSFHAAACFSHGGHAYLVNSYLMPGFYVHPLGFMPGSGIDSIPRSDRPEDHRDLMLLRE